MFTWCLKKLLLKVWQIPTHVDGPQKKLVSENTIIPQDSQRGEPKTEQHGVIKFKYPTMPTKKEMCRS
jgi:hypothetical protein